MSIAENIRRAAELLNRITPPLPDDGKCDCEYCNLLRANPDRDLPARLLAAIPDIEEMEKDAARLDFIETMARRSYTGVSFDYATRYEDERGGYRMMWHHKLNPRFDNVREAADAAALATQTEKP